MGSIALRLTLCLALFNIIGVVVATICDILPDWLNSRLLTYAIWLVAGIFCGVRGYSFAGAAGPDRLPKDWADKPDSGRTSLLVIGVTIPVVALLSLVFWLTMWRKGVATDPYVPDNPGLTATFFGAVVVMMIVAHKLRPAVTSP